MQPDDPRHGSYAGAVAHWFDKEDLCPPCELAERRYRRQRQRRMLNGEAITVPSVGSIRRLRALMALGWRGPEIAARSGVSVHTLRSMIYHDSATVLADTAQKIARAYDQMSMTIPSGPYANRARILARSRKWAPPLAWDEGGIDDPDAAPLGTTRDRGGRRDGLDLAKVDRILAGEWDLPTSPVEKAEVVRRWLAQGGSLKQLGRKTGWNTNRYRPGRAA